MASLKNQQVVDFSFSDLDFNSVVTDNDIAKSILDINRSVLCRPSYSLTGFIILCFSDKRTGGYRVLYIFAGENIIDLH